MRILVAEDDEDSRVYLEQALSSQGYEVECAENGAKALTAIYNQTPDLIISDIMMPRMDGFALCRNIKSDEVTKHIPFIFYTATYLDSRDKKLGSALGADRYLEKPMELLDFLEHVKAVLQESQSPTYQPNKTTRLPEKELSQLYEDALSRKLDDKILELELEQDKIKRIYASSLVEIEKKREVEVELLEKQFLLDAIVNKTQNVLMSIKHISGNYLFINDYFQEAFNVARFQVIGKKGEVALPANIAEALKKDDSLISENSQALYFQQEIPHHNGKVHRYTTTKTPYFNKEREFVGVITISTNITDIAEK